MSVRARVLARPRAFRAEVFDLVVVGGSSGGVAAARWAAARRARTLLVRERCRAPEVSGLLCALRRAADAGASGDEALACARAVGVPEADGDAALARAGVEVRKARAVLRSPRELEVDGRRVVWRRLVLATGSSPATPPVPGLEPPLLLGLRELVALRALPRRLAVLGDGPQACALAQACARLGSRVVLVARGRELLPGLDRDAARAVEAALREAGVELRLATEVAACERSGSAAHLVLRPLHEAGRPSGEPVEVDRVASVLRVPDTEGLGLDHAGIRTSADGLVEVDHRGATSLPGVYAVGPLVAQGSDEAVALEMGEVAAAHALARGPARFGRRRGVRTELVPTTVLVRPEVATVGRTEAELARARPSWFRFGPGRPRPPGRVAVVPLRAIERARLEGAGEGFVKLLASPEPVSRFARGGRLVGATVVGGPAAELVHEAALAIRARLSARRLAEGHCSVAVAAALGLAAAELIHEVDGRRWRPPTDVLPSIGVG